MGPGDEMVFAIHFRVRAIWFRRGYCEGWSRDGEWIRLLRPFRRCRLKLETGHIDCRGGWPDADQVPGADHTVDPCAVEVWMLISTEDLHEAANILALCIEPLDPSGFNRLSDL
jgi:hypothetical protein